METIGDLIKLLGGLAGIAALVWRVFDEFGAYLRISLKVDGPKDGWITALTAVENKGNRAKNIAYAVLLVGPESEDPISSARRVAAGAEYSGDLESTNQLEFFRLDHPVYTEGRALIPLPFYYSENIDVADETLTYRAPIDSRRLEPEIPYAVRFFVFCEGRLHRSTHDAFINGQAISTV